MIQSAFRQPPRMPQRLRNRGRVAPACHPSTPSALLPALASGFCGALRVVLEVAAAGLTSLSACFRCTLRIFGEIAFTTSTLGHVLGLQSVFNMQVQGTRLFGDPPATEVRVIFGQRDGMSEPARPRALQTHNHTIGD